MPGPGEDVVALRITSAAADLARLYPWLDDAAAARHLPEETLNGMHVALEEAVMNVAMHAYGPGDAGKITITLVTAPGSAELVVEDHGPPFDATAAALAPRPESLADAEPGGAGLTLLRHFCRDVTYERVGDRNRLTMRFTAPAG